MSWTLLIEPLTGLVKKFIDKRRKKEELEEARHYKMLEGIQQIEASEFAADIKRTEDLASSWKDEFITIVVTIPLFLCFMGPEYAEIVTQGFMALAQTPEWFQYLVIGVYSVGAGVPIASKSVKTIKSISKI